MVAPFNLEEYLDPELYDLENPDFDPEGSFYLHIAKEMSGPVLELGCGTGRIAIPMAQSGLEMTGLDVVPGMLALARTKAGNLPIHWIEADVRNFHVAPLQLRYTFPQEMEALLERTSFEVIEHYGGPDRSPLKGDSRYLVFLCQRKGG